MPRIYDWKYFNAEMLAGALSVEGKALTGVVNLVRFQIDVTEGDGADQKTASYFNQVYLTMPTDSAKFVSVDDARASDRLSWAKKSLGEDGVARMEREADIIFGRHVTPEVVPAPAPKE